MWLLAGALMAAAPVLAAVKTGTPGDDKLRGTAKADRLDGKGGSDRLFGRRGRDMLRGGSGHDLIKGGPGSDRIDGGRGYDRIVGGRGGDIIVGGRRPDEINMRNGVRIPSPGNDVIHAVDIERDQINCGSGRDKVFVDRVEDGVYDCEKVIVVK